MGTENQISQENAEAQIDLLEDYYEKLTIGISETEKEARLKIRNILINAVMKGRLEIAEGDDSISIVQTAKTGDKLTYAELGSAARLANDKAKGHIEGLYAMAGSLTGLGFTAITKLKNKDLDTVEALTTFLLMD